MQAPKVIKGGLHSDHRGELAFNNDVDLTSVKRVYTITNKTIEDARAWQGHRIEQRWFSSIQGEFCIELIKIENWKNPAKKSPKLVFKLKSSTFDILHIPPGYISSIKSLADNSKLLVMADFLVGEIKDEYRYDSNYFI